MKMRSILAVLLACCICAFLIAGMVWVSAATTENEMSPN